MDTRRDFNVNLLVEAVEIAQVVQGDFATLVSSLISGGSSMAAFSLNTASPALPASICGHSADTDGDGVPDVLDAFPLDAAETTDTDGDGIERQGSDDDGDGVNDSDDVFPLIMLKLRNRWRWFR